MADREEINEDEVTAFLEHVEEHHKRGLQFGNYPQEAVLIAAITLIANKHGWRIRRELTTEDGEDGYEWLLDNFIPRDGHSDRKTIQRIRGRHLNQYLK